MESDESFWVIPESVILRTPLGILREQAEDLTRRTKGLLKGVVRSTTDIEDHIIDTLIIEVPNLGNYKFAVLDYTHPVTLYPGLIEFRMKSQSSRVADEASLLNAVKTILKSSEMQQVVLGLLAQAKEATA